MGATAAVGTMAGGSALGAASNIVQGMYNNKIAKYNAQIASQQANQALERGMQQEQAFRVQVRGMIGSQRVGYASQGVDVNRGTPAEAQAQAARFGEMDALQIRANAAMEAWGYKVQAVNFKNQGQMAMMSAIGQAGETLATGGYRALSMYSSLKGVGAFDKAPSSGGGPGNGGPVPGL